MVANLLEDESRLLSQSQIGNADGDGISALLPVSQFPASRSSWLRLVELRRAIIAGEYHVPSSHLADALLSHARRPN